MLFGGDCVVLFYESFPRTYAYTPLGWINDPEGLAEALGPDSATVCVFLNGRRPKRLFVSDAFCLRRQGQTPAPWASAASLWWI